MSSSMLSLASEPLNLEPRMAIRGQAAATQPPLVTCPQPTPHPKEQSMIVVMEQGATEAQIQHVVTLIRELGLKDHVIKGTERTVIAAIGDDRAKNKENIENAPAV